MTPTTPAIAAMSHATRRTCCSRGLSSSLDALRQRGDPAELGVHAGREDDAPARPRRCGSCR